MFYAWHWDMDYESYLKEHEKNLIVLTGHSEETRIIEGDFIHSFGRYKDIESYMIDSKSYSLPVLASQRTDIIPSDVRYIPDKFDNKFIKAVAKIIFGEDIEVREPILGEDIPEWPGTMFNLTSFLTVELENQGNAKFTKYFMGKNYGWILDAKTGPYSVTQNMDIERFFEFTKDLKNYFVMTHDLVQETFKIDFYDINLNKIWSREFEGTENAVYDYTEYNLYLIANNDLYTINLDNGEDTYQSQYIGDKLEIRKLENGILTISKDNSDGIMMLNLDGSILWKRNLEYDVSMVEEVQLNGENIVVSLSLQEDEDAITEQHYLVIDKISGEIKLDAVTKSRIQ